MDWRKFNSVAVSLLRIEEDSPPEASTTRAEALESLRAALKKQTERDRERDRERDTDKEAGRALTAAYSNICTALLHWARDQDEEDVKFYFQQAQGNALKVFRFANPVPTDAHDYANANANDNDNDNTDANVAKDNYLSRKTMWRWSVCAMQIRTVCLFVSCEFLENHTEAEFDWFPLVSGCEALLQELLVVKDCFSAMRVEKQLVEPEVRMIEGAWSHWNPVQWFRVDERQRRIRILGSISELKTAIEHLINRRICVKVFNEPINFLHDIRPVKRKFKSKIVDLVEYPPKHWLLIATAHGRLYVLDARKLNRIAKLVICESSRIRRIALQDDLIFVLTEAQSLTVWSSVSWLLVNSIPFRVKEAVLHGNTIICATATPDKIITWDLKCNRIEKEVSLAPEFSNIKSMCIALGSIYVAGSCGKIFVLDIQTLATQSILIGGDTKSGGFCKKLHYNGKHMFALHDNGQLIRFNPRVGAASIEKRTFSEKVVPIHSFALLGSDIFASYYDIVIICAERLREIDRIEVNHAAELRRLERLVNPPRAPGFFEFLISALLGLPSGNRVNNSQNDSPAAVVAFEGRLYTHINETLHGYLL